MVHASPFISASVIFFVFGLSAAAGPLLATRVRDLWSTETSLLATAACSIVNVAWFAICLRFAEAPALAAAIIFIVINVVVGRLRNTVLDTHRQRFFKGSQYARIMSWSYAFDGAGTLLGVWIAYLVGVPNSPESALWIAAVLWIAPTAIVVSKLKPAGKPQKV